MSTVNLFSKSEVSAGIQFFNPRSSEFDSEQPQFPTDFVHQLDRILVTAECLLKGSKSTTTFLSRLINSSSILSGILIPERE
jgi:hypothetical protein